MTAVKPEELENLISVRIREFRKRLRMTQADLANEMGCTKAYISQLETGICSLGVGQLAKLAEKLKTSPANLVREPAKPRKHSREKSLAIT
jgi:transcriptional regulator with XRE-family HTH domain